MTAASLPEGLVERCAKVIRTFNSTLGRFATEEDLAVAVLAVAAPALREQALREAAAMVRERGRQNTGIYSGSYFCEAIAKEIEAQP